MANPRMEAAVAELTDLPDFLTAFFLVAGAFFLVAGAFFRVAGAFLAAGFY